MTKVPVNEVVRDILKDQPAAERYKELWKTVPTEGVAPWQQDHIAFSMAHNAYREYPSITTAAVRTAALVKFMESADAEVKRIKSLRSRALVDSETNEHQLELAFFQKS